MAGALEGIKIIELASYVTGPFASVLLADLGAQVIKIETPGEGDPFRGWGEKQYAATFCSLNRNKKSLTLDIRKSEGREVLLKLVKHSDVFIENLRPGALERRGLGYDELRVVNPKIIYCSISGFTTRSSLEPRSSRSKRLERVIPSGAGERSSTPRPSAASTATRRA